MDLMNIVLVLLIVGMVLWAVNAWVVMDARIKSILNTIVIVIVVIWLISTLGVRLL